MARRRQQTRQSSRPRRPVEWLRVRIQPTILLGAAGVAVAAVFNLTAGFPGFAGAVSPTIVRIRGRLDIAMDIVSDVGSWGAGLVQGSVKAVSAGITAIPIPYIDDADWQWIDGGCVGDSVGFTSAISEEDLFHVIVDTKSMRKYEQDDQALLLVVVNATAIAGDDMFFCGTFSILLKE